MVKYYVSNESGHECCFHASVMFKHNPDNPKEEEQLICECHDQDTAKMICDALNRED